MPQTPIPASSHWRFQTAMILAVAADALQVFVLPLFAEGALSPADDLLDLGVAAVLVRLLGWRWEFLPAFAAELVPGLRFDHGGNDLVVKFLAMGKWRNGMKIRVDGKIDEDLLIVKRLR